METSQKTAHKLTLEVTDVETFDMSIDIQTPNLDYALNMLAQGTRFLTAMKQDAEAIEFQHKMQQAAQATRAMMDTRSKIKM